jgi:hypothetical protein
MKDKGYLQFTHPIVYSANYAHASYPEVPFGGVEVSPCDGGGYLDELKGGGPVWQTWRGGLRDAADQAWSGYGGGWGSRVSVLDAPICWGPLGPSILMALRQPGLPGLAVSC